MTSQRSQWRYHLADHISRYANERTAIAGKTHPRTSHQGTGEEYGYTRSYTLCLTSALDGSGRLTLHLCRFTPGKRPGNHGTRGCVGFGKGVGWCGKSRPTAIRFPGRPARNESVYRLTHSSPCCGRNAVELYSGDA
jgi:hypothetical protein